MSESDIKASCELNAGDGSSIGGGGGGGWWRHRRRSRIPH